MLEGSLFGSQACGEAKSDTDLLDKPKIEVVDYDEISYPLRELAWEIKECIIDNM